MSARKLSRVSSAEMAEINLRLQRQFEAACDTDQGITSAGLTKWATDAGLLDRRKLTASDVGMIFASVKLGKKTALKFDRFQEAVRKVAIAKECTFQEVVQMACGETPSSDTVRLDELEQPAACRKLTFSISSENAHYTLKQLQSTNSEGVEVDEKPFALSDAEFEVVFCMSKDKYKSLAGWKKTNLKKAHGLLNVVAP